MLDVVSSLVSTFDAEFGPAQLQPVTGDASGRSYFRVVSASCTHTYILMVLGQSAGNEELGEGGIPEELPFVYVQRLMAQVGVPVPAIYAHDEARGLMILEDFGDTTLFHWQQGRPAEEVEARYQQALDILALLQVHGTPQVNPKGQVGRASFGETLFRAELEHYVEFGLERRFRPLAAEDRAILDRAFPPVCAELAALPRVLVHRDYHSRNLMVYGDHLGVIDFQDALMGPGAYDLVSLLCDAYVPMDEARVDRLLSYFMNQVRKLGGDLGPGEQFRRSFDLCTLQRCLKAAGRFEFFWFTRGNDRYLPDIPNCITNVRRALQAQPDLAPVWEVFARYEPAFR